MNEPLGVGIVGCGSISGIYMQNINAFERVRLVACADLDADRARWRAGEFDIPRVLSTEALLADDEVDIVLNLTTPQTHYPVAHAALQHDRHIYNEKPLTIELDEAKRLLSEADARGLHVGCAPDTFLGAGLTTARRLLDENAIGEPVGGCAFFTCPGHEAWHPDPDFYYQRGGGPVLDMGPYYLTALVTLLGPVRRVTGSARRSFAQRTIGSEARRGQRIEVEVPTHVAAVLDFASGPVVSLMVSFDVHGARLPMIEIYGSERSMAVPDPNMFDGPVEIFDPALGDWRARDLVPGRRSNSRGLGVAEMAEAIASGRPHRASGAMALHVLEIMHAVHEASRTDRHVPLETTCARPEPLPADWSP
ncbi:MAG: Gfo/Idh/MocA family oxidoreductase [Planctomycetota bacterium]|nr:Gfo/Idh/MocA family oxidoreductase [Planctomycetota bacterium]